MKKVISEPDWWELECSQCGELEERSDTHDGAIEAAEAHLAQHKLLLDTTVTIKEVRYLIKITKEEAK